MHLAQPIRSNAEDGVWVQTPLISTKAKGRFSRPFCFDGEEEDKSLCARVVFLPFPIFGYAKNFEKSFIKPIDNPVEVCYNMQVVRTWPHSQAAKTSPSHGEGVGSIPTGVTKSNLTRTLSG